MIARRVLRCVAYTMIVWGACAWFVTSRAEAQFTPPVRDLGRQAGVILSDSSVLAHDTDAGLGWFHSATADFSRYTPGMCLELIALTDHQARGWLGWDTLVASSRSDTLTTDAFEAGRRCATRFTATTVESRELGSLVELAVATKNDPLALAALDRRLQEAKTTSQRGSVLLDAVTTYHNARPRRSAAAESLLVRFDAMTSREPLWKMMGRDAVLPYSAEIFDTTNLRRIVHENFAAIQAASFTTKSFAGTFVDAGRNSEWVVDLLAGMPVDSVCERAAHRWIVIPPIVVSEDTMEWSRTPDGKLDVNVNGRAMANSVRSGCLSEKGTTAQAWMSRLNAFPKGVWFLDSSMTPGPAPKVPVSGRATLLVSVSLGTGRLTGDLAAIRQLYRKYHGAGLDAVLFATVPDSADHAWASAALDPEKLAKVYAWYFHDYLDIPIPLLIARTESETTSPHLFDKNGIFKVSSNSSVHLEAFIRNVLGLPPE